jgi:hypothetical protein
MKQIGLLQLPGEGTTNVTIVAAVADMVDPQGISRKGKEANADVAARSIWPAPLVQPNSPMKTERLKSIQRISQLNSWECTRLLRFGSAMCTIGR